MTKNVLYIVMAILLLLCLADMPYGYYQLVRFVAMASFAYLSYESFKAGKEEMGFAFATLAILFQPFFKIALGRVMWNVVDVVVAIGLIYLLVITKRSKNN